jgi:DnaK suppressor protein
MTAPPDARQRLDADRTYTAERLAGLVRELDSILSSAQVDNADDEHDPEGPTIAFEREHTAALIGQGRRHLEEIDAALERVADGSYGQCTSCGRPIGAARLAARPAAATCIDCAARAHRRR